MKYEVWRQSLEVHYMCGIRGSGHRVGYQLMCSGLRFVQFVCRRLSDDDECLQKV